MTAQKEADVLITAAIILLDGAVFMCLSGLVIIPWIIVNPENWVAKLLALLSPLLLAAIVSLIWCIIGKPVGYCGRIILKRAGEWKRDLSPKTKESVWSCILGRFLEFPDVVLITGYVLLFMSILLMPIIILSNTEKIGSIEFWLLLLRGCLIVLGVVIGFWTIWCVMGEPLVFFGKELRGIINHRQVVRACKIEAGLCPKCGGKLLPSFEKKKKTETKIESDISGYGSRDFGYEVRWKEKVTYIRTRYLCEICVSKFYSKWHDSENPWHTL